MPVSQFETQQPRLCDSSFALAIMPRLERLRHIYDGCQLQHNWSLNRRFFCGNHGFRYTLTTNISKILTKQGRYSRYRSFMVHNDGFAIFRQTPAVRRK